MIKEDVGVNFAKQATLSLSKKDEKGKEIIVLVLAIEVSSSLDNDLIIDNLSHAPPLDSGVVGGDPSHLYDSCAPV